MMNIEPQELMKRISELRDQELLRIAYGNPGQYRPEAITYAKAEINLRGISFDEFARTNPSNNGVLLPLAALGRKIRNVIWDNAFGIGFVIGLFPFVWTNFDSYNQMYRDSCDDCFVYFGFPFYLYQTGGFAGPTLILWDGLIANAVIAVCTSICTGWILDRSLNRVALKHSAV